MILTFWLNNETLARNEKNIIERLMMKHPNLRTLAKAWLECHGEFIPGTGELSEQMRSEVQEVERSAGGMSGDEIPKGMSYSARSRCWCVRWTYKYEAFTIAMVPVSQTWKAVVLSDACQILLNKYRLRGPVEPDAADLFFDRKDMDALMVECPDIAGHIEAAEKYLKNAGVLPDLSKQPAQREKRASLASEVTMQVGSLVIDMETVKKMLTEILNKLNQKT